MSLDPISAVLDIGGKLIDKLLPDPQAKAAAQLELIKLQQSGELAKLAAETDLAKGQLEINKVEAASSSLFVSGWRPSVGWICAIGLAYQILIQPILSWYSINHGLQSPPDLDMGTLITLLGGMLGLGAMRMNEKIKGVAR